MKIRGAREIKAVSFSLVKATSVGLDGRKMTKDLKKMAKRGGAVPEMLKEWQTKLGDLKKSGMMTSRSITLPMIETLTWQSSLRRQGGPFTKPEQVEEFMKNPYLDDITMNKEFFSPFPKR